MYKIHTILLLFMLTAQPPTFLSQQIQGVHFNTLDSSHTTFVVHAGVSLTFSNHKRRDPGSGAHFDQRERHRDTGELLNSKQEMALLSPLKSCIKKKKKTLNI